MGASWRRTASYALPFYSDSDFFRQPLAFAERNLHWECLFDGDREWQFHEGKFGRVHR